MIADYTLLSVDSASELRLKLEVIKEVFNAFCSSSGLDAEEDTFVQMVKCSAHEIQLLSDALTTLLCDALEIARKAERDAEKAHEVIKKAILISK